MSVNPAIVAMPSVGGPPPQHPLSRNVSAPSLSDMRVKQTPSRSPVSKPEILLRQMPQEVCDAADKAGLTGEQCLFSIATDLALDGVAVAGWVLVTERHISAYWMRGDRAELAQGPIKIADADKARILQTVGSAFLQMRVRGVYVDIARFSNGYRESFGLAVTQLKRLIAGEPLQDGALKKPSEMVCAACGMPLPARKAPCPKCAGGGGIFTRTLGLMRPYWTSIFALVLVMVTGVCLDVVPPIVLTPLLVDKVLIPKQNMHWLPWIITGLVGAAVAKMVIQVIIGRTSSFIGTRITKDLRERLQSKLMGLSVEYYNRHSAGSLMSRVLHDVDYFQGFVNQVGQGFLVNIMLLIGIGIALFTLCWQLALLVLLPIPLVCTATAFYWSHLYPRYHRVWDSQSKLAQQLVGVLQGIRLVKTFGQEEREKRRFEKSAGYMQQSRRSLEMGMATFNPVMGFFFGLGGLIVWYAGGHRVLEDKISLGTLMSFFGLLGMFYGPVQALSLFSGWITGFLAAGQRVFEVLDSTAQIDDEPDARPLPRLEGAVEFRNVTFGYDPYSPVLKNVSLKIEPGQFVGIVGKSGSGKTTLVNLICRFYEAQEGEVLVDGHEVRSLQQDDLHRHVGLVLQEPFLFRASIAENIAYGRPDATPLAIINAAKAANAHDFIARKNAGYDTKLGENGAGLSGGERQRISIARALLCDPRILILDEATSSVDTESEQEIQRSLAKVCKGRTTIAIAHRLSTLKNADVIYVVDEGRIAESGPHDELMAREGIYAKLVKIQTELTRLEA